MVLTKPSAGDPVAAAMSEDDLQECVRQLCRALNVPYFHVHDSRRSPDGWPDVVAAVGQHLLFRELKTMTGKPTPAQLRWLEALSRVRVVSTGIWRPDSWRDGSIVATLQGKL